MGTATNPNSTWLFPGRRAGQPLRPEVLGEDIRNMGLPTILGRTAALRQLVLQAPAPVVAGMLVARRDAIPPPVGPMGLEGTAGWSASRPARRAR